MRVLYTLSEHAKKRIQEPDIPHPKTLQLHPAGRSKKKRIRKQCELNKVKGDYIYMSNDKYVFVCIQQEVSKYLVITAFEFQ
jgi:hypothetical protein